MARCRCKVEIQGFRPRKAGYAEVMNGHACQQAVFGHAARTKSAADGMLSADGYDTAEAHKMGVAHGVLANGYYVRTGTNHAKRSTLKHNTLKKALQ